MGTTAGENAGGAGMGRVAAPSRKMMDLKQFMWRQQVRQLYRSAMKTASRAPEHARADLRASIRAEFDAEEEVDERRQKYLRYSGQCAGDAYASASVSFAHLHCC